MSSRNGNSNFNKAANFANMVFGQFVVYDNAVGDSDRIALTNALTAKWSI